MASLILGVIRIWAAHAQNVQPIYLGDKSTEFVDVRWESARFTTHAVP